MSHIRHPNSVVFKLSLYSEKFILKEKFYVMVLHTVSYVSIDGISSLATHVAASLAKVDRGLHFFAHPVLHDETEEVHTDAVYF